MAPGSRHVAVLAGLLLGLPGCWTGHLIESGRTRESVLAYRGAAIDGDMLRIDYTAERVDARQQRQSKAERSALLALDDLDVEPEHPVDAFPLRRVSTGERGEQATPLRIVHGGAEAALAGMTAAPGATLVVEVDSEDGRHLGFRLCPEGADVCPAHFHSGALTRYGVRWWIYPLMPLAVGADIAIFPLQAATLPPLLWVSD